MGGHHKSLTVSAAAAAALDLGQRKPSHRCTGRIYSRCWPGVLPARSVKIGNGSVAYILFYDIFFSLLCFVEVLDMLCPKFLVSLLPNPQTKRRNRATNDLIKDVLGQ